MTQCSIFGFPASSVPSVATEIKPLFSIHVISALSLRARWPDSFLQFIKRLCASVCACASVCMCVSWLTASLCVCLRLCLVFLCCEFQMTFLSHIPTWYESNLTQLHLRSYLLTCCEQEGGNGAKQANAEQRDTERGRGRLRSGSRFSCASIQSSDEDKRAHLLP